MSPGGQRLSYLLAIGVSSVLLFSIQPMIAKALLPRFGGSAGLWVTCMLFFQVVLVLGYLYAFLLNRHLTVRAQRFVHLCLVIVSLGVLPWSMPPAALQADGSTPVVGILTQLAAVVGLPYFVLSTTGPLLQSWYAATPGAQFPYRFFAWSNLASLAALLAYPAALERLLPLAAQLRWWSISFLAMAVCVAIVALQTRDGATASERFRVRSLGAVPLIWIALAACASTLWLAVVNHLNAEVAAIPLLWVLPLGVYLLSFILCFEFEGAYRRALYRWLLPAAWAGICYRLALGGRGGLPWELAILLAALFVCCMFCHGELARGKPDPKHGLAFFYLMVALGGALGGVFVAVVAPHVFNRPLELPVAVTGCVLLALGLLYAYTFRRLLRLAVFAVLAFVAATSYQGAASDVVRWRNFYGTLQVSDSGSGAGAVRSLYNGRTLHGRQFLDPLRSREALTFYGPESGGAMLLRGTRGAGRHVGIIGLGVGTLAAYGRPGDTFRFFEINPAVVEVASRCFRFLKESAAVMEVVLADGRLGLEREPAGSYDALILDAFSDDSVPVHLLTREAFQLYFRRLRPGGSLAVHITNRYLDLAPVVRASAAAVGRSALLIRSGADREREISSADWVVVTDDREVLTALQPRAVPVAEGGRERRWTDNYSGIFSLLR